MANERELCAEIVQSGTWLYDNQVLSEVWIVKQNFEFHREPDFPDGPEELNADGRLSGTDSSTPVRNASSDSMLGSCSTFVVAWSRPNTADGALSAIPPPETCQA
jgi:hypothetical protein